MKAQDLKAKWRIDIDKDFIREQILDDKRLAELESQMDGDKEKK